MPHGVQIRSEAAANALPPECRACEPYARGAILVNQLWLWILGGHTVVACFPHSPGFLGSEEQPSILREVERRLLRENVASAIDAALVVVEECGNFNPKGHKLAVNAKQAFQNEVHRLVGDFPTSKKLNTQTNL